MRTAILWMFLAVTAVGHPNHQLEIISTAPAKNVAGDILPLGNGNLLLDVWAGIAEDTLEFWRPDAGDLLGRKVLGRLRVITGHDPAQARAFTRKLDLQTASVEVTYRHQTTRHRREYFVSHPDQIAVAHFRSTGRTNEPVVLAWESEPSRKWSFDAKRRRLQSDGQDPLIMDARAKGGAVAWKDGKLTISGASEVALYVATASARQLDAIAKEEITFILQRHVEDYQRLFHAMYLTIEGPMQTTLTTERRLQLYREKPEEDLGLEELFFQYARSMTITRFRGVDLSKTGDPEHGNAVRELAKVTNLEPCLHGTGGPLAAFASSETKPEAHGFARARQVAWSAKEDAERGYAAWRGMIGQETLPNLICRNEGDAVEELANLGAAVALTRFLLAEEADGTLRFLPALPKAWPDGSVVGMRSPSGAFEMAFAWQNGKFLEGYVTALQGGECKLAAGQPLEILRGDDEQPAQIREPAPGMAMAHLSKGEEIRIRVKQPAQ